MAFGRSLELYFVDGRPEGLLTARVFNWTGQVLKVPRTQLREALMRPEARFTGVYVLLGERDGRPLAYIGEGEEVGSRIRDHDGRKDWWTTALVVTTSGDDLNKAHVKYLESRLVEKATSVGTMPLDNGNVPPRSSLSEAGVANMEEFLDTLHIVFPALGVDMFVTSRRPDPVEVRQVVDARVRAPTGSQVEGRFVLELKRSGIRAEAILENGEFVVLKGAQVRNAWSGDPNSTYGLKFKSLVASGVISVGADSAVFTDNYAFSSPSAASAIITGRSSNGRLEWKLDGTATSYGDWEAARLAQVPL